MITLRKLERAVLEQEIREAREKLLNTSNIISFSYIENGR
jgi:hypothetical protein